MESLGFGFGLGLGLGLNQDLFFFLQKPQSVPQKKMTLPGATVGRISLSITGLFTLSGVMVHMVIESCDHPCHNGGLGNWGEAMRGRHVYISEMLATGQGGNII